MKMTLIELLKYKKEKKALAEEVEFPVANPLGIKFNSLISIPSIHVPNYTGDAIEVDCKLKLIEEYTREIDDEVFTFTDYVLSYREGSEFNLKLRIYGEAALLLTPYESMPFSKEMDEVLEDTERTGKLDVTENDTLLEYFRVNGAHHRWYATIKSVTPADVDSNGKVTKESTSHLCNNSLEYWDFERDNGGVTEYIIVEMKSVDGWITMRKGTLIDPQLISVI